MLFTCQFVIQALWILWATNVAVLAVNKAFEVIMVFMVKNALSKKSIYISCCSIVFWRMLLSQFLMHWGQIFGRLFCEKCMDKCPIFAHNRYLSFTCRSHSYSHYVVCSVLQARVVFSRSIKELVHTLKFYNCSFLQKIGQALEIMTIKFLPSW